MGYVQLNRETLSSVAVVLCPEFVVAAADGWSLRATAADEGSMVVGAPMDDVTIEEDVR